MSDNRWPNDNTRFRVEAKDFETFLFSTGPEDEAWKTVGRTYEHDTFTDAVEELEKYADVYRELRIVRTVDTIMATYKDGVASE